MASFTVTSRRWGHPDTYRVKRTATGWDVQHISVGGPAGKDGHPGLFACLGQDFVNYPSGLRDAMETLWEYAEEAGLSDEQLQECLDQLAAWVTTCETSRPDGIFDR
jgi:hypothetical protein